MKTNKYIHFSVALIASLLMFSENAWGYTATFSTGLGNPAVSPVAESYNGGGITLPDGVTPAADDWEFAGWAMASCSESTKAPVLYLAGTEEFTLTANTTMYAVYRKYTSGTSTVTFNAADISNLTAHPRYSRDWTDNTAGIDLYLSAGQRYTNGTPNTWTVTKSTDAAGTANDVWNYAMITAYRKISQIIVVLSGTSYLIDDEGYGIETDVDTNDDYAMQVSSPTDVEPYTQTVSRTGDVDEYATQVWMFSTTSQQIRAKSIQITYYNAKFNSNPCDNLVELTAGTKTNVSSITFSLSSVPTCSSTAADRQVTITVTPSSGYTLNSTSRLEYSGDGTAAYVSGPTDNGNGTYSFVYQFEVDDDGSGTFAATAGRFTNYRTKCCTEPTFAISGAGKRVVDGKTVFDIVREDLAGGSTSTANTITINFTSNSEGAIAATNGQMVTGDIEKVTHKIWRNEQGGCDWECYDASVGTGYASTNPVSHVMWEINNSSPATGEATFSVKTTGTNLTGQGTYRVGIHQEANGAYCEAFVWIWINVAIRDKFIDRVNANETINRDGHRSRITTPSEGEMDVEKDNDCHETTRRLRGWIKEADLMTIYGTPRETGKLEEAAAYEAQKSLIVAPNTAEQLPTGVTWYAVWGEDNTPEP